MILDHQIRRIVYLWEGHSCELVPYLMDTNWLRANMMAVVHLPISIYPEMVIRLETLRQLLMTGGYIQGPYGITVEMKTNTSRLYQCYCG